MRKKFIAGNWKMNMDRAGAVALAEAIAKRAAEFSEVDVAVCPPFVYLDAVRGAIAQSNVGLGAQNMFHEPKGAFTGEISAAMLLDMGCKYVILGHSERRDILGESNSEVNHKLNAALKAGLTPIVCVGEHLNERENGQTASVIRSQFEGSFANISAQQMEKTVIAYEPVWAIGTGKVATPQQAEEVHADLRKLIESRYNAQVASAVRIQYGGSVKASNAGELMAQPNIDGALVGGASLVVDDFIGIIAACKS
ncbi:MAG TPA: triose-phosphate isomerase [Pirellulales bacterium]|jgi:triosephosphate isomerase|nr:triose-phosphate isomerase [Pirellulales bacterium]